METHVKNAGPHPCYDMCHGPLHGATDQAKTGNTCHFPCHDTCHGPLHSSMGLAMTHDSCHLPCHDTCHRPLHGAHKLSQDTWHMPAPIPWCVSWPLAWCPRTEQRHVTRSTACAMMHAMGPCMVPTSLAKTRDTCHRLCPDACHNPLHGAHGLS